MSAGTRAWLPPFTDPGTAPPIPTSVEHTIVWEYDDGWWTAKAHCHAPIGDRADCRLAGECDCESWSIKRDPDGTPYHEISIPEYKAGKTFAHVYRHEMHEVDYCNIVTYLDEGIDETCVNGTRFTLPPIPIEGEWDSGVGYQWKLAAR